MEKKKQVIAVIVILLIAAALWALKAGIGTPGDEPERALPLVAGDRQFVVKMENPETIKERLKMAMAFMEGMRKSPLPMPSIDSRGAIELLPLFDAARQAAMLGVVDDRGQVEKFYLSFIPNPSVFDEMMSGSAHGLVAVTKWEQDKGPEGWTIRPALSTQGMYELYVLRSGTSKDSPILIARNTDAIDEMLKALKSSSSRVKITRHNPAPDYIQARFPVDVPSGRQEIATTEAAWIEDATSAHAQFYSDAFSLMTGKEVPRSGLRGDDLPLLGSGDLAVVSAVDIPYACFTVFPKERDPIGKILSAAGSFLPASYRDDLSKIMTQGRISAVVTVEEGKDEPSTAYLVIETKAVESLDRLIGIVKPFMSKSQLAGWESVSTFGLSPRENVVMARRGGILLLGIGDLSHYERKAIVPASLKDFAAPKDLAYVAATEAILRVDKSLAGPFLRARMKAYGLDDSLLDEVAAEPFAIQLRTVTPEKADLGIYWSGKKKQ